MTVHELDAIPAKRTGPEGLDDRIHQLFSGEDYDAIYRALRDPERVSARVLSSWFHEHHLKVHRDTISFWRKQNCGSDV